MAKSVAGVEAACQAGEERATGILVVAFSDWITRLQSKLAVLLKTFKVDLNLSALPGYRWQ